VVTNRHTDTYTDTYTDTQTNAGENIFPRFRGDKDRACVSGDILADRETDTHTHTDVLITILRNRSRWRSNKQTNKLNNDTIVILTMCHSYMLVQKKTQKELTQRYEHCSVTQLRRHQSVE